MTQPAEDTATKTTVGMALGILGRQANRLFTEVLEPTGIKPRHLGVLHELRFGPSTQQALSVALHTDPTQLVALLNELEASRFVTRRRDAADRRRHIVELSSLGRRRLAEVERRTAEAEERLLVGLDPAERASFVQMLTTVAVNAGVTISCDAPCDD
jgi:DNA-binding MarR family transcriptional regulator